MIKAIKKTRTVEEEGYESTCKKCGKVIFGSTENQVVFNMGLHQAGKSCFEQRVQNQLPPRTPGYVSPNQSPNIKKNQTGEPASSCNESREEGEETVGGCVALQSDKPVSSSKEEHSRGRDGGSKPHAGDALSSKSNKTQSQSDNKNHKLLAKRCTSSAMGNTIGDKISDKAYPYKSNKTTTEVKK